MTDLKFLYENYEGDIQELVLWFEKLYLRLSGMTTQEKLEAYKEKSPERAAELVAKAKTFAYDKVKDLNEKTSRAALLILNGAEQDGWFRLVDPSFDTLQEFVASHVDAAEEGTGQAYDWAFISQTALPLMEAAGIPPEKALALPYMASKARHAVPALRELMSCPECGRKRGHKACKCHLGHNLLIDEQRKEEVDQLLTVVGSSETTVQDVIDASWHIRGKQRFGEMYHGSFNGIKTELGGGEFLYIVKAASPDQVLAIETKTRAFVSWEEWSQPAATKFIGDQLASELPILLTQEEADLILQIT